MIPRRLPRAGFRPHSRSRAAAALVIVLFVIVLVIGLVVAFLNAVKTERVSTANFLASSEVRKLADNVVGVVESQINYAATRGTNMAWASQPGMIRTYSQSGSFDRAYKLYSAGTLTETDAGALTNDIPPAEWRDSPAIWADLNSPVTVNGVTNFPIFDPAAALDPDTTKRVKGITISAAPGATKKQPAPMPVRWLYVLQNGQMTSATGSGKSINIPDAGPNNPIIGRVAFWTDDDTCKINVNTAGAGSYWDTPHFNSTEERKFATSQPLNGEFQRYPGHPAMTDLTTVFPMLTAEDILKIITPRYQWGGSEQGTKDTYSATNALSGGKLADKPLFASVDEIKFLSDKSGRTANAKLDRDTLQKAKFFLTANSRAPELNLFNLPRVACWPISTDSGGRTAFDQVIALCSTISPYPYYFQRQNALSPTEDAGIDSNKRLFGYLQNLSNQPMPGFGVSLNGKFRADTDQVLTEIWDYIRSTNLYDSRLPVGKSFTADPGGSGNAAAGHGYVVPLEVDSNRGFGRSITLSELAFLFICTADSVDPATEPDPLGLKKSNDPDNNLTLNGTALDATKKERRIQLMLLPEFFSPSLGDVQIAPKNFRVQIEGLSSLHLNDGEALFSNDSATLTVLDKGFNESITHVRRAGGQFDYRAFFRNGSGPLRSPLSWDSGSNNIYSFISNPVTVSVTGTSTDPGSMTFSSGVLKVTIQSSANGSFWETVQTIRIKPPASASIPVPNLVCTTKIAEPSKDDPPLTDPAHWWAFSFKSAMRNGTTGGRLNGAESGGPNTWKLTGGVPYIDANLRAASLFLGRDLSGTPSYTDVVRSMVPSHGDYRLIAASKEVPQDAFTTLGNWSAGGAQNALIHTLAVGIQRTHDVPGNSKFRRHFITSSAIGSSSSTTYGAGGPYAPDFRYDAPAAVMNAIATSGDFDNPPGSWSDGAFINKPDEGNIYYSQSSSSIPYFIGEAKGLIDSKAFFSPNRMIPGPGMFGSLPTHVQRYLGDPGKPETYAWRTLLFRKQPNHPNSVNFMKGLPDLAPDHLIMDLFWMPTVEPYAISEPFATAGKINMNYQIQPFTYLVRKTAMLAVLKNEKIPAIPNTANVYYKQSTTATPIAATRQDIDANATLEQFDTRFDAAKTTGRIFLSPSELCDLWLVPSGRQATDASMQGFWADYKLTGDNLRERPYTGLIPRLTTKSNTYTVHFRVQRLKTTDPAKWEEDRNTVTAEYRGSTTVERFLDPNATYPDYIKDPSTQPGLDTYYRWRTVENRQFSP